MTTALLVGSRVAWGREEILERPLQTITVTKPRSRPAVGEHLGFHGWWFGIPVGSGWIEIKELVDVGGRAAYHIEAQGHSNELLSTFYPIHDVVHSYLDVETLQPLRFEKTQREGHYRADEVVTFNYATSTATYHSLLNQSVKEIALPSHVQDLISAFYWLRTQPLEPTHPISIDIYTDEKIYQTLVEVRQPLILELLKRGTFSCLVVEPHALFKGLLVKRGRIWAYLTVDEYRLPLLIKATTPWGAMSAVIDGASIPVTVRRQPRAGSGSAGH